MDTTIGINELSSHGDDQYDRQWDNNLSKTITFWQFVKVDFSVDWPLPKVTEITKQKNTHKRFWQGSVPVACNFNNGLFIDLDTTVGTYELSSYGG